MFKHDFRIQFRTKGANYTWDKTGHQSLLCTFAYEFDYFVPIFSGNSNRSNLTFNSILYDMVNQHIHLCHIFHISHYINIVLKNIRKGYLVGS